MIGVPLLTMTCITLPTHKIAQVRTRSLCGSLFDGTRSWTSARRLWGKKNKTEEEKKRNNNNSNSQRKDLKLYSQEKLQQKRKETRQPATGALFYFIIIIQLICIFSSLPINSYNNSVSSPLITIYLYFHFHWLLKFFPYLSVSFPIKLSFCDLT